jgi:hypothetical protein
MVGGIAFNRGLDHRATLAVARAKFCVRGGSPNISSDTGTWPSQPALAAIAIIKIADFGSNLKAGVWN